MSLFIWNSDYAIDNGIVDEEHQRLFKIARHILEIEKVGKRSEEIKDIVRDFYDYARTHFEHEEAFMSEISFPGLESHKIRHAEIVGEMNHYLSSDKHMTRLLSDFRKLAVKWVFDHIMEEDMKIRDFLETSSD